MKSYCSIFEFLNKLVSINLNFRMTSISRVTSFNFCQLLSVTQVGSILFIKMMKTLVSNEALLLYDKLLDMKRLWKILKFQTQDVALIRLLADMDSFINHLTKEMYFSGRTNYQPATKTKNFQLSFHRQRRDQLNARTLPTSSNETEIQSQSKISYQVNSSSESILLTELELRPELQAFLPGLGRGRPTNFQTFICSIELHST